MHEKQDKSPRHIVADQTEVAAFLEAAANYPFPVEKVKRIDTHGAMVFLAGTHAFKIKRAVAYPYMDFSTLEKRRSACEREVELNRRTAPEIYIRSLAITRCSDGALQLDGTGTAVEYAVEMRRFRQEDLLSHLAASGNLTQDHIMDLAENVRRFHATAEIIEDPKFGARAIRAIAEEDGHEFAEYPDIFPSRDAEALTAASLAAAEAVHDLLDRRLLSGFVRHCHGDLHLRNICLHEGQPRLFDAIEFNDSIAKIDVAYDLAFLLMDLEQRGLKPYASLILSRYLRDSEDLDVLAALPLFLSLRAAIRAKVAASTISALTDPDQRARTRAQARDYLRAALGYLEPKIPMLVAVGGRSGTGKTTLSRRIAPELGRSPGGLHLRSDVLRKALLDCPELEPLPPSAYHGQVTRQVYRELERRAGIALTAGQAVVVDAAYLREEERDAVEALATGMGIPFHGIWLEAPKEALIERVGQRQNDASDATADIVELQDKLEVGAITWSKVDVSGPAAASANRALSAILGKAERL